MAAPALFTQHSASRLTNTMVYEVQAGATWLVQALLVLVRDALTLRGAARLPAVAELEAHAVRGIAVPAVALVMRGSRGACDRLTRAGQQATDELAYVVEENVLAWRIVRLHGAAPRQSQRFDRAATGCAG